MDLSISYRRHDALINGQQISVNCSGITSVEQMNQFLAVLQKMAVIVEDREKQFKAREAKP